MGKYKNEFYLTMDLWGNKYLRNDFPLVYRSIIKPG